VSKTNWNVFNFNEAFRKVAMVETTIATVVETEVTTNTNLGCQAILRTRFMPLYVLYNL
jgi:hypothetical protein